MELYVRFISTLAFGLIGLGAVLKVLLETIFEDWDVFREVGAAMMSRAAHAGHVQSLRAEDILMEAEKHSGAFGSRVSSTRRRQMRELDAVETRLSQAGPVTDLEILPS